LEVSGVSSMYRVVIMVSLVKLMLGMALPAGTYRIK
jgi:hypothetical protein